MIKLNYEYNNVNSESTILFLHGWGLSGKSFDGIISRLKNISYIKVDLYGFGQSDKPKDYFDTYEYVYQIFLLIKKLKVKKLIIVGHSFGGRLGIILSSVFKIDVKNLILTSSAGLCRFSLTKWLKIRCYKVVKILVKLKILNTKLLNNFGSKDYKLADNAMQKILVKVVNQDLTYLLKNIKFNTMLVWDKKDNDTPYWICKKLNRLIIKSQVVCYKSGGHFTAFKNINKFSELINNMVVIENN